jgi:endonuclease/exonuclease/phosphatase family metal-dependent hydrolase
MQPETEIKYFKYFPENYKDLNLIFAGDFNCPQSHTVFNPWRKMNFLPAFKNQKTSLKKTCKGKNCLASEFDNIWFNGSTITLVESKAVHFYKDFKNLDLANDVSDHIPISISFILK